MWIKSFEPSPSVLSLPNFLYILLLSHSTYTSLILISLFSSPQFTIRYPYLTQLLSPALPGHLTFPGNTLISIHYPRTTLLPHFPSLPANTFHHLTYFLYLVYFPTFPTSPSNLFVPSPFFISHHLHFICFLISHFLLLCFS